MPEGAQLSKGPGRGPRSKPAELGVRLTPREKQLLDQLVTGSNNREIGAVHGISEETVKHHLYNICNKLGLGNRIELVVYWMKHQFSQRERRARRVRLPPSDRRPLLIEDLDGNQYRVVCVQSEDAADVLVLEFVPELVLPAK